jgi:error-prone DNA polymerase
VLLFASVGHRGGTFLMPHGRGDELNHGGPRSDPRDEAKVPAARNVIDPHLHLDEIRVRARNFH